MPRPVPTGADPPVPVRGSPAATAVEAGGCTRCGRSLVSRATFTLGGERRCLRCALRSRPLLRRSALTACVVGTVLVAINQGTTLATGTFPPELAWKVPLTYLVPFCVATWGALSNSRG